MTLDFDLTSNLHRGTPAAARILVVDDNRDNREVLTRRLRKQGFEILEAESGRAALTMIEAELPDMVLLDHMMPDLSGLETLAILRGTRNAAELPVIMVTAFHSEDMVTTALGSGANDFVTKPISFPILLARMQAHLARKRAEALLQATHALLDRRITEKRLELEDLRSELEAERAIRQQMEIELLALRGATKVA
jgi:DNA-binding response OmpR family regulator